MIMGLDYKVQTASEEEMFSHLQACSNYFTPPLHERLDVATYASKLRKYAITFEAWDNRELVGLIAAYLNDESSKIGFISNVSVCSEYTGKGIASRLLDMTITYARDRSFIQMRIETIVDNFAAINLYEKFQFKIYDRNDALIKMAYPISTNSQLLKKDRT